MNKDFQCPFCKADIDAWEYGEGSLHKEGEHTVECPGCQKEFIVGASNSWSWEARCKEGEHKWVDYSAASNVCENCGELQLKETDVPY